MNKTNAKHGNQALAIILSMTLIFVFFSILSLPVLAASSANSIDLMDTVTSGGTFWTYDSSTKIFTVNNGADVTVSGSVHDGTRIVVNGTATITLNSASIISAAPPLQLSTDSNLTLILADGSTNTLSAISYGAGIEVNTGTALTIRSESLGDGSLTTTGDNLSAGIGSAMEKNAGTIKIYGGSVTANGGNYAAGIGGGSQGSGGTTTIYGGSVTAKGGGGAGIGGGYLGSGGMTTISGGSVTAQGGVNSPGIGGGGGSGNVVGSSGTIIINGGSTTAKGGEFGAGIGSGSCGDTGGNVDNILIYGENTKIIVRNGGHGAQDIGTGGSLTSTSAGAAGNVFVVMKPENLIMSSSPSPTPNSVAFSSTPASGNTITATLPAPFSTTIDILSSPGVTSKSLSVITTFTTESISFALADYLNSPISKTGTELMQSGAAVAFSISDAALSGLIISQGTLSPAFTGNTLAYTASVGNSISGLTLTPTANDTAATVTVNGTAVASGSASGNIALSVGANTIAVEVTAQDGITKQTYTVTITRAQASGGGSATVYYTVTATAGAGGSISPSGSASVAYDNDKTYTITADEGYAIADVLMDGVSVGAVSTYTFENVNKAHTISASFKKITVNPFSDVKADDWFYKNALYVYENGLMTGTGPNVFSPNGTMTRAMIVTVLYRMSGDTGSYTNTFSDVTSGAWYETATEWAAANGIVGGVGGQLFAPESSLTREQLAVMLYNYAKYKGLDVSVGKDTNILAYNDAFDISDYAYAALQWACGADIINGDNSGNLAPQSFATRAEVAAMLERFIKSAVPD